MSISKFSKKYAKLLETDVIVIGSGTAGSTAAIAAARQGVDVVLVERFGYLGGISTSVLDTFYGFYTPGNEPRKVVGGIPDEIVIRLQKKGAMITRPNTYGAGLGITYDPETLKIVWDELICDANVRVLFHTLFLDVLMEEDRCEGVLVATKSGIKKILAPIVIDASGDGDVAYKAGAQYEDWRVVPVQSLTTTFRLINVDWERASKVTKEELWQQMRESSEKGEYNLPRKEGSLHITPFQGVIATNMVRVYVEDPTDPFQLSNAEIEGRKQAIEYYRFLKEKIPGYENAILINFSTYIGVRESRRIIGEYWLTRDDVLGAHKFEDTIAVCGAPIEDHRKGSTTRWEYVPNGAVYGIPYRCLIPKSISGILIAGRCVSASHDAHASLRSMGQCMAMGQAAGIAAAICRQSKIMPKEINVKELQKKLIDLGAILD